MEIVGHQRRHIGRRGGEKEHHAQQGMPEHEQQSGQNQCGNERADEQTRHLCKVSAAECL